MKTAGDILREKNQDFIYVGPEDTLFKAMEKMNQNKIGAMLIKDEDKMVGIWTERDLLRNAMEDGFDPRKARIKDYMTTGLQCADHNDTVYQLLDKFLGKRLSHLLIKKEEVYIGMLSTGDVIKASLNEKNQELSSLNAIVSWEYYENWRWRKKK